MKLEKLTGCNTSMMKMEKEGRAILQVGRIPSEKRGHKGRSVPAKWREEIVISQRS